MDANLFMVFDETQINHTNPSGLNTAISASGFDCQNPDSADYESPLLTVAPSSLPTRTPPTPVPSAAPTLEQCTTFELHGTAQFNAASMGRYTHAGEHNGKPCE